MTTATQHGISVGTWDLDLSHSHIGFTVRHIVSKVRGAFESFEGTLVTREDIRESGVNVSVDLSSINTGSAQRDEHLRSSDFFNVEHHPKMSFTSTGVTISGDDQYTVSGELSIGEVTRPVELAVEFLGEGPDPWSGTRLGVEATTSISRQDFGIDFNIPIQGERAMIGNKIDILITAEAVLQQ